MCSSCYWTLVAVCRIQQRCLLNASISNLANEMATASVGALATVDQMTQADHSSITCHSQHTRAICSTHRRPRLIMLFAHVLALFAYLNIFAQIAFSFLMMSSSAFLAPASAAAIPYASNQPMGSTNAYVSIGGSSVDDGWVGIGNIACSAWTTMHNATPHLYWHAQFMQ